MSLLEKTRSLCKEYGIKPLRRRGQNFLINEFFIEKIMMAAELKKTDVVLEIGTGLGDLTKAMAGRVKKIITVEIDRKILKASEDQLKDYKNVEVVQGDIRDKKIYCYIVRLLSCYFGYKVVANIPFNLTGLILRKFLTTETRSELMVLIMQKEVGERIIARPPKMSRLAVMVGFYGSAEIIGKVSRNNFWPWPKVDSIILRIRPFNSIIPEEKKFFKILNAGFSSPRKYLLNNLVKGGIIKNIGTLEQKREITRIFQKIGLDKKVRAQELRVEDWVRLVLKM